MNYIKQRLKENFISRREFSQIIGLDHSHFNKLLNGKFDPMRKTIRLIAQGLQRLDKIDWKEHAKAIEKELEK